MARRCFRGSDHVTLHDCGRGAFMLVVEAGDSFLFPPSRYQYCFLPIRTNAKACLSGTLFCFVAQQITHPENLARARPFAPFSISDYQ